jgi:hypothetical protein
MALHEMIKNVKIIDEILVYLVDQGYKKVNINFELNKKDTKILVTINNPKPELIQALQQDICAERGEELEEYGWELMGEDHHSCELQQVGMLIDRVEVIEKENKVQLLLVRKM